MDRYEFRTVIHADSLRTPPVFNQPVEYPDDPLGRQAEIYFYRKYLTAVVVYHIECPEPPAVAQGIAHEVHGPADVLIGGDAKGLRFPVRQSFL